jgi:3-hydroxyacyl-CoA dehydrogenase/enoyl-CoA hydratase/3-hydroxybutyryl-CoA epimerase/enoyl-CoA isomerase
MAGKILFQGDALKVERGDGDIAEIVFDLANESVNKFNQTTLHDLRMAVDAIKKAEGIKGVLSTSAKDVFIVGADVMEQ